jgi:peptidoglycan hydrolase CwlO-like protein
MLNINIIKLLVVGCIILLPFSIFASCEANNIDQKEKQQEFITQNKNDIQSIETRIEEINKNIDKLRQLKNSKEINSKIEGFENEILAQEELKQNILVKISSQNK